MDEGLKIKEETPRIIDFIDKTNLFIAVPEIRNLLKGKVKKWQDEGSDDEEIIFLLGQVVGGVMSRLRPEDTLDVKQVSADIDVLVEKNKTQKPD